MSIVVDPLDSIRNMLRKNPIASDEDYFHLCQQVYDNSTLSLGAEIKGHNGNVWKVIEWKDTLKEDGKNGMQAIAVVPLEDFELGKTQYNTITYVFRGTEPTRLDGDLTADIHQITIGHNKVRHEPPSMLTNKHANIKTKAPLETQFDDALQWVKQLNEAYQPKYVSVTGHSLGGGLAQFTAAELNLYATTYAAPNIYRLLSKEGKLRVKNGTMQSKVKDFVHSNDWVGNFEQFGAQSIGKQYHVKGTGKFDPVMSPIGLGGHPMTSYAGMFNKDGSIQLKIQPEEVMKEARRLGEVAEILYRVEQNIRSFQREQEVEVTRIKAKFHSKAGGGEEYSLLSPSDVDDIITDMALHRRVGIDLFYDIDLAQDLLHLLKKNHESLGEFSLKVEQAAQSMQDKDFDLSQAFKGMVK
ncbi:cytoplasmic protein [Fictibacillus macauensis ZFHKF-1]|uniref:Cytoplasmic protein n=1 Tax=Fictibacillus macauensis ZFHKF-1 TaxID=1196324 RepID=I8J629_9BACL|nr:lipase family protein [Fictibacillus macauensis]EIT87261.1 cytoplasmic protein [Fictibacillus macauensis ZFHKF-1]